ncbi:MAG: alpha/beta hydrolase [Verrucomicrobiota bacterium]
MPKLTHDQIEFNYRDNGSGIPFVFQHGLGADVNQTFGIFRPPSGFRLLSFDCRAHGETRPVGNPEKIGIAAFADDLGALMDCLKIERAIIGGISMGAAIALNFALRFSERAMGLVLSRPAWLDGPRPDNVTVFAQIAQLIRQHGARRGREEFLKSDTYAKIRSELPDTANSLLNQFNHPRAEETVVKLERIPGDAPNRDLGELARIRVPTLVLANRLDPIHPFEYGEVLARSIPGAEFKEITSKSVSIERHESEVQHAVADFLERRFAIRLNG